MRAKAIKTWLEREKAEKVQVKIHQALEETHKVYKFGVGLYNWIQRNFPVLHHIYFNYLEVAGMCATKRRIFGADRFIQVLDDVRPDMIVSVHGTLNHGFFELAKDFLGKGKVVCVTYCGELAGGYGFSKHWVNPDVDLFIGATNDICEAAAQMGVRKENAWEGGFILRSPFFEDAESEEDRRHFVEKKLGFDPDKFILVLGTGAVGANNHLAFLRELHRAKVYPQVLALCGKSKETLVRVKAWAKKYPWFKIKALAYIDHMPEVLRASSAIVTRPGTGTTSEAILCGCPIILNGLGGIMPQEMITRKFCRKHEIAAEVYRPKDLPKIVEKWMREPKLLGEMRKHIQKVSPNRYPRDIAKKLISMRPK